MPDRAADASGGALLRCVRWAERSFRVRLYPLLRVAREPAQQIYDVDMGSAADAPQELVVDGPLAEELERRGVHVHDGDRVQLQLVPELKQTDGETAAWEAFVGSFTSGDPDLAEHSEEILRAELGR